MLEINCPWCGPRAEIEFRCGGESNILRPGPPEAVTDAEWGDYLFYRNNPRGPYTERWVHAHGCRRWFNVMRDTVSHRVLSVSPISEPVGETAHGAKRTVVA